MKSIKNWTPRTYLIALFIAATAGIFLYEWLGRDQYRNVERDDAAERSEEQVLARGDEVSTHTGVTRTEPRFANILSFSTTRGAFPKQHDTYQIALDNYRDRRLQFDNCVATIPIRGVTFTGGSDIMIEGKSYDTQIIRIGGQEVILAGYDFAIVTLPKVTDKKTILVDCEVSGTQQYNVTTLTLYP